MAGNKSTTNYNTFVGSNSGENTTSGGWNSAVGDYSLQTNTTGTNNTAIGQATLYLNTTGGYNTALGSAALGSNTPASNNTAVGYQAGYANTTGSAINAFGYQALDANTTGANNIAMGNSALGANTTGSFNTAMGDSALAANTTANDNVAVGQSALDANTTGASNVALGRDALGSNTTASQNTAVGYQAMFSNTTGAGTAVGYQTLYANTEGQANAAFGWSALGSNTTGSGNTAVGQALLGVYNGALFANTTGANNTAVGSGALIQNTTASNNTAVGFKAGYSGTTASENVIIGTNAGYSITTGVNNTFVGGADPAAAYGAGGAITTGSKNTIIGRYDGNQGGLDIRTSDNNIVLSDGDGNPRLLIDSSGNVGIGTNSPQAPLNVYGSDGIVLNLTNTSWKTAQIKPIDEGGSFKGSLAFFTHPTNGSPTTPVERLRIDSSGNVGIGTSSPAYNFVVSAAGASGIEFAPAYSGTANLVQHYSRSGGVYVDAVNEAAQHRFNTAGTERMRIDSSGNLLVGTTFSSGKLTVNATGDAFSATSGVDALVMISKRGNDGDHIRFLNSSSVISGNIGVTGTTTYYNTSSDYRLKEDVQPMVGASDRVLSLKPVNFAWKVDGTRVDGFLAHEAQAVVPEAVTGEKDGEEMQGIDQSKLVPLLTAALQEALTKIEALEARITALESA